MLGGTAHLVSFLGTDTIAALKGASRYYGESIAGFSIPASEHSTMTSWGKENEEDAYRNMLELFSGEGKLLACVSDSYDIYNAVRNIWGGSLKEEVINSGGTLVVRPDSGDPLTVPIEVLDILAEQFGFTVNSKGYKVLPPYIRVIQGDGLNMTTLPLLIENILKANYSLENIAFGMGGGLLQDVTRDTYKYAMKASARRDSDGVWHDVFKDPIGGGKTSKKGRLGLVHNCGVGSCSHKSLPIEVIESNPRTMQNMLIPVFKNGELLVDQSFSEIRARAASTI